MIRTGIHRVKRFDFSNRIGIRTIFFSSTRRLYTGHVDVLLKTRLDLSHARHIIYRIYY